MSEIKKIITDRYPGPKPYGEKEKDLFFGRSLESEALWEALSVHNVFVLHAESGLGKSSLIAAGLIPKLRTENYLPVLIRFKDRKTHPSTVITEAIHEALKKKIQEENIPGELNPEENDTWKLVKKVNSIGITPILIFDQFEEFNYFNEAIKKEMIRILAELVALKIPDYIRKEFADNNASLPEGWYAQPHIKIMFSIRTDRIGMMEEFADAIPETRANRYELSPIQSDQGEQIVILPAAMEPTDEIDFNCQGFQYEPNLITTILDIVKRKNNTLDTTQLQIICLEIQERVKAKPVSTGEMITITEEELGGRKGLEDLVKNFYSKQLDKISQNPDIGPVEYLAIRVLLEKKLIVQQKKDRLSEEALFQHFRDSKVAENRIKLLLDELLGLRLIRGIDFEQSTFYEIAHDTLIDPILEEMQKRELEEKLEKENKEAEDLAREQEEKLRKQRLETAKEMELKNKAIAAEMHAREEGEKAREAEKNANTARLNVERLKKRNDRLARLFFLVLMMGIGILIFFAAKLSRDKKKLKVLQEKATKSLITIYKSEADRRFNSGEWLVAHSLSDSARSYYADYSSLLDSAESGTFPPFSIALNSRNKSDMDIQVSKNSDYVGTRYSYRKFIIWKMNDQNNTVDEDLRLDGITSFLMLPNNMVILIDTNHIPSSYQLGATSDTVIRFADAKNIFVTDIKFLEQSNLVILEDSTSDNKYFYTQDDLQHPHPGLTTWYQNQINKKIITKKAHADDYEFTPIDKDNLLISVNNEFVYLFNLSNKTAPPSLLKIQKNTGLAVEEQTRKIAYNAGGHLTIFNLDSRINHPVDTLLGIFDIPRVFFCKDSFLLIEHYKTKEDKNPSMFVFKVLPDTPKWTWKRNTPYLKMEPSRGMNMIGFTSLQAGKNVFNLFDAEKRVLIPTGLPAQSEKAGVKNFKFDEINKRIYVLYPDSSVYVLTRTATGSMTATSFYGDLPIKVYGNTFIKFKKSIGRTDFIILQYQDGPKNNLKDLLKSFHVYIDKEITEAMND